MLDGDVKRSIIESLKSKFDSFNVDKCFDLFEKIIFYNTNKNELDGVRFNWETALNVLYNENSSFSDAKRVANFVFNIEPFLKKILFIIDKQEYKRLVTVKEGLYPLMKILSIDPQKPGKCQTEIKIAYELRNLTSHQAANYPRDIFYTNIESCICTVMCAISNNLKKLYSINFYSAHLDVSHYMDEIISSFKSKIKKYINLDSREDISTINTLVIEDISNIDDIKGEPNTEPRNGEVDFLRKNRVPEKKMLLIAEAGIGKTTTIEHLAYSDALEKKDNVGSKIPVVLYLNLLIDPKLTIFDYISKKLGVPVDEVDILLKHGEINLFLDGLNEIPNISDLRNARLAEINNLIDKYRETFVIISTRPQASNFINKIPRFFILSLNDKKQLSFIEKNCLDSECKKMVISAIESNEKIKRVVRTPLFLSIFAKVVYLTKKIPTSEGDLIKVFINSLLEREIKEKNNLTFDVKKANYLLRGFAYFTEEKYKANSGVIESEIVSCFINKMKEFSFSVDVLFYLSVFVDLGLIAERDGLFCFFHESYQDYFYSEELKYVLGIK